MCTYLLPSSHSPLPNSFLCLLSPPPFAVVETTRGASYITHNIPRNEESYVPLPLSLPLSLYNMYSYYSWETKSELRLYCRGKEAGKYFVPLMENIRAIIWDWLHVTMRMYAVCSRCLVINAGPFIFLQFIQYLPPSCDSSPSSSYFSLFHNLIDALC